MAGELHSVVTPMYNEQGVAEEFVRRLRAALETLECWELVIVDDGSRDDTFAIISRLAAEDPRIKVARLARNFGHQTAITAGIDLADGDTVTVIDADLQDPPELIPQMVQEWRNGADIVFAVRESRAGESGFKKATAHVFYRVLKAVGNVDAPVDSGDFRLMSRKAAEALRAMREQNRYVRGMVGWLGMKRAYVSYPRDSRFAGDTKYPLGKMIHLATDGIVSFSIRPLQIAVWLGLAASAFSLLVGLDAIVSKLRGVPVLPGWSSLMVAILFMGGIQLFTLGIIGEYIGRIYDEARDRPLYLIAEAYGFDGPTGEHFEQSPVPERYRRT